ncbi:uncharacterized protein VTP21DRAFT_10256 [Calcarisporiella thermophila]|uniref:uncharacterized protein n=1 Tax=Calcarisporiella thermophila TaxID=911321 RepID=UPI0037448754
MTTINRRRDLLMYRGFLDKFPVKILVDGGASDNFVTKDLAYCFGNKIVETPDSELSFANGDKQICSRTLVDAHLRLGEYEQSLDFIVADLPHYDIVLGKTWLVEHNPQINWRNNTITFFHRNQEIEFKNALNSNVEMLSAMQMKRLTKQHEIYLTLLSKTDDNESNNSIDNPDLEVLLNNYNDVFPDSLPPGLPPERTANLQTQLH